MASLYAIQILSLSNNFTDRTPYIVMWNQDVGPVESFFPIGFANYTIYKYGSEAMSAAGSVGNFYTHRLVLLSSLVHEPTNIERPTNPRQAAMAFEVRDPGGAIASEGTYFNFSSQEWVEVSWSTPTVTNVSYSKPTSKDCRVEVIPVFPGQRLDLFQQFQRIV